MPRKRKISTKERIFKSLKDVKTWGIILAIAIPVIIVGIIPLSGLILNVYREDLLNYIKQSYAGDLHVEEIRGNIATGLIMEDVYFLPENEEMALPVWTGDRVTVKFSIWELLKGNARPKKVILEDFVFRFEQRSNGSFKLPPLYPQPLNAQGGKYEVGDIGIVIKNSEVIYRENQDLFEKPLQFKFSELDAYSFLKKDGELRISSLDGKFLNCEIHGSGKVDTSNALDSDLNIEIKNLGLWQMCDSLGRLFPSSENCRPAGNGDVNLIVDGSLLSPQIDGRAHLEKASIGNFHLEDVYLDLSFKDKYLRIKDGIAKSYDGRIALEAEVIASSNPSKFIINAEIINFNLGRYISETWPQINPVSGLFNGQFKGDGNFEDLTSFSGTGALECGDGMYLNPFRSNDSSQPRKYRAEKMGFDNLKVDFNIKNRSVDIKDFSLGSRYITIQSNGSVSFAGYVNVEGIIKAQSELFRANDYFSDIMKFLPDKDIQIPVRYRLWGPVQKLEIESAIPGDMIDDLIGDDEIRREAAKQLLEEYLGSSAGDFSQHLPTIKNN